MTRHQAIVQQYTDTWLFADATGIAPGDEATSARRGTGRGTNERPRI